MYKSLKRLFVHYYLIILCTEIFISISPRFFHLKVILESQRDKSYFIFKELKSPAITLKAKVDRVKTCSIAVAMADTTT